MGRKVYLAYTSIAVFISIGSQARNSHRAAADAQAWREERSPTVPHGSSTCSLRAQGRHHLH